MGEVKRHKRGAGEEKQPKSSKRKWKVTYQKKKKMESKNIHYSNISRAQNATSLTN